MANSHSTNKQQFMVHMEHELRIKLEKRAAEMKTTITEALISSVVNFTRGVKLSSDDYAEIARRVKKEEEKRAKRKKY